MRFVVHASSVTCGFMIPRARWSVRAYVSLVDGLGMLQGGSAAC
jgi:hypothetical protein